MSNHTRKLQLVQEEYRHLAHAMQSGAAQEMELNDAHTPKHLRVGVNSSLVSIGALTKLLMTKGVISELEYWEALRDGMREEVQTYEKRLSDHYGVKITLG